MFKIYGWKEYLKIPRGFIIRKIPIPEEDKSTYVEFEPKLSVAVREFDIGKPEQVLSSITNQINTGEEYSTPLFSSGWYAANLERICIEQLNYEYKNNTNRELFESIKAYDHAVKACFFIDHPASRANYIYKAYVDHHKLTEKCYQHIEMIEGQPKGYAMKKIADTNVYPWVHYVSILEHRARVLIIKNAIELSCMSDNRTLNQRLAMLSTPHNFKKAIQNICNLPYKHMIPYFFHVFIEIFGGFYVDGTKDKELLASITGIPEENVEEALKLLSVFFPTDNEWFFQ